MTTELFSGSDLFVKELSYPGTSPSLVMFHLRTRSTAGNCISP